MEDPKHAPDVAAGVVQLLLATLADPLNQDLRTLGKINLLVGDDERTEVAQRNRERHGRAPYKRIPCILVTPPDRDSVGDAAAEVFHRHYRASRACAPPTSRCWAGSWAG